MPDPSEPKPFTHRVAVDQAMAGLDYDQMIALAEMFESWAFGDEQLDDGWRTKLLQWSADYERIAAYAGVEWKASDPDDEPDFMAFLANDMLRQAGRRVPADANEHVCPPLNARELLDGLASKVEEMLETSYDPEYLMGELLHSCNLAGILDEHSTPRLAPAWVFVRDVLIDNPAAYEWAQWAREWLRPENIEAEDQLIDAIRPV